MSPVAPDSDDRADPGLLLDRIRAGLADARRSPIVRLLASCGISAAFLAIVLARVDLRETLDVLAAAAPTGILLAIGINVIELGVRAQRWRFLLAPVRRVPFRAAFDYLNIGYFANTVLPVRLGDGARALLAGRSFGISTLAVLGTIVVERIFDAAAILGVVVVTSLFVARGAEIAGSASILAAAALVGMAIVAVAAIVAARVGLLQSPQVGLARRIIERAAEGGQALRTPVGVALMVALTLLAFGVGVVAVGVEMSSLGLMLSPPAWAVLLGVLALSTALPAAPGSVGTYEFVGVTALGVFGIAPSQALAATVLIHVLATIPPALLGRVAALVLHVRIGDLRRLAPAGAARPSALPAARVP